MRHWTERTRRFASLQRLGGRRQTLRRVSLHLAEACFHIGRHTAAGATEQRISVYHRAAVELCFLYLHTRYLDLSVYRDALNTVRWYQLFVIDIFDGNDHLLSGLHDCSLFLSATVHLEGSVAAR